LKSDATVSLISLGCAKNTVDSEILLGILEAAGYPLVEDYNNADIVLVNTCSFIEPATEEATALIRQLEARRKDGTLSTIVVTGCLPQRFRRNDLAHKFPWVDAFLGPGDIPHVASIVEGCLTQQRICKISSRPTWLYDHRSPRVRITPPHTAYVKIAEGCFHACSFCLIPDLRGRFRSRRMRSVLDEIRSLASGGRLREVNLVAQDTTAYGRDLYGKPRLRDLMKRIAKEGAAPWIRLLYAYPRNFHQDLIDLIAAEPSICSYIDLPLQHCNDEILKRMRRGVNKRTILGLLDRLRASIPNVTLRTTLIVGFPGETEKQFEELFDFVVTQKFDRLGVFPFWAEEGTAAARYPDQVPEETRRERMEALMLMQQILSGERNKARIGEVVDVLIEGADEEDGLVLRGRTQGDAPEVDGAVLIPGGTTQAGEFARVKITGATEYDLLGEEILEEG